jgi:hypothetical protein
MNPAGPELDVFLVPVNMQNAARLLDTESLQDQPIGGILPPPDPTDDPTPTPQERSTLKQYRTAYLSLFRDAVSRVVTRDKPDFKAVAQTFGPVLESISGLAEQDSQPIAGDSNWQFDPYKAIEKQLTGITERAAKWKPEDVLTIAASELTRAVRAMVYASSRSASEHRAAVVLLEDNHAA